MGYDLVNKRLTTHSVFIRLSLASCKLTRIRIGSFSRAFSTMIGGSGYVLKLVPSHGRGFSHLSSELVNIPRQKR